MAPVLLAQPALPPAQQTFSLQEAVTYALQNKAAVQNAQLDQSIARGRVEEIRSQGLPQINGSASFNHNFEVPVSFIPGEFFGQPGGFAAVRFGIPYTSSVGLNWNQLIFDGTYFLGLRAAKVYEELAAKGTERTKVEAASAVSKAYYTVLVTEERLKLLQLNYLRLDTLYKQTKAMYEQGLVEKIDADRLLVSVNNSEAELAKVTRMVEMSRQLLKFQMGFPIADEITLTDRLADVQAAAASTATESFNYENRIEYSLLNTQRELDEMNIRQYRLGYFPRLTGFLNLGANTGSQNFGDLTKRDRWFNSGIYGLTLSVPVFDGLYKKAKIDQAKFSLLKTENQQRDLKLAIDFEQRQSATQLTNALTTLEIQKRNLELAQEIFRVSDIKYREGVGASLEVINAQASVKEAETNYFNALYDALIARIDYQKAFGTLTK